MCFSFHKIYILQGKSVSLAQEESLAQTVQCLVVAWRERGNCPGGTVQNPLSEHSPTYSRKPGTMVVYIAPLSVWAVARVILAPK